MSRYIPNKYIFGMALIFVCLPISLIILLLFVIGIYKITIAFSMFLTFTVIISPLIYIKNLENSSLVIKEGKIINNVFDGTSNYGWEERMSNIKTFKIANKNEIMKYYKNCKSKKVLLVDFGNYNIKYISLDLFTKKQIRKILDLLKTQIKSKTTAE